MGKEKKNPINVLGINTFRKHGIVDFNGLFAWIPQWLRKHGYDAIEKGRSEKSTSTGRYMESNWVAEKNVTAYVKYVIKINLYVRDLSDVAVEKKGKTIKLQRGRVELDFKSVMEKNYVLDGRQRFNQDKDFQKFLQVIYERYIAKNELQVLEDKLLAESKEFVNSIQPYMYP